MIYSYDLRRTPLQNMTATLFTNYEERLSDSCIKEIQFQDMLSTYWRRGESMEAALISSQSSLTFCNYIKFDVWKSFVFGYVEWTRRQAMVKYKVSSGQQFRMNRKNSWLAIIQISLDCHDSTCNGFDIRINALRLLIWVELEKMLSEGEKDGQGSRVNTQRDCVLWQNSRVEQMYIW